MKKHQFLTTAGFMKLRLLVAILCCLSGIALGAFALKQKQHSAVAEQTQTQEIERGLLTMPIPQEPGENEASSLGRLEQFWNDRLTYPTGHFNPAWLRSAADQHDKML